jgi:proteasome lid subunit RPN8/RPN11
MNLILPEHVMLKLRAWRDMGGTEVTGFFITEKNCPFKVIDAVLAKADCSVATVNIKPEDIQDLYIEQSKAGVYPDQLMIWWHTHPGNSASPSGEDQKTFNELGKDRTINYMYILSKSDNEVFQVSLKDKATGLTLESELEVIHPVSPWENFPDYSELRRQYDEKISSANWHQPSWRNNALPIDGMVNVDNEADDLFDELDDLVKQGAMLPEEADEEALLYGWEHDFYTSRRRENFALRKIPGLI